MRMKKRFQKNNTHSAYDVYKKIALDEFQGKINEPKSDVPAQNPNTIPKEKSKPEMDACTGIVDIRQTQTSEEDGGVNTLQIRLADGRTCDFTVRNGSKGKDGASGGAGGRGPRGPKGDMPTFGLNTTAGSKAFTILAVDGTHDGIGSYTLDSTAGLEIGDIYTAHVCYTADNKSGSGQGENYGAITAINGNIVTVDRFYLCEEVQNAENPVFVAKTSYLDSEGHETEQNTFRIAAKPLIGTRSVGHYTMAEGRDTRALSKGAHAEGYKTVANGSWSHAEGKETEAQYAAHSEGGNTKAIGHYAHAEGYYTRAEGFCAHAEGQDTVAGGYDAHAEGAGTRASGMRAHAEGTRSQASGDHSHAEGQVTMASGKHSHAEGYNAKAEGGQSHAEGDSTQALGGASHAEGRNTTAQAQDSHAEGFKTQASGHAGHAEGNTTIASGDQSHAQGWKTEAGGARAHAGGESSVASGLRAFAHGNGLKAAKENQAVFGQFNENKTDTLFEIGNGTGDTKRSNAFEVTKTGTGRLGDNPIPTVSSGQEALLYIGDTQPAATAGKITVWINLGGVVKIIQ